MAVEPRLLTRFPALAGLPDDMLEGLAANLDPVRYRSGSLLCREGSPGESCFFLIKGDARVTKRLPDGRRVRLATLSPGTLFGQSGLVKDQERTADVVAQGDVQLLSLERNALDSALLKGEPWAVSFQNMVAIHLIRQLRTALDRLNSLALQSDMSWAIEGTARDERRQTRGLDIDTSQWKQSGPRRAAQGKVAAPAPWEEGSEGPADDARMDSAPTPAGADPGTPDLDQGQAAAAADDDDEAVLTNYGLDQGDEDGDPMALDTLDLLPLDDSDDYELAEIDDGEDDLVLDGEDQADLHSTEAELLRMLQATESSLATSFDLKTISFDPGD